MSIVCHFRNVLFLALFAIMPLPDVSCAKDIKDITSTDLKEAIRSNKDKYSSSDILGNVVRGL